MNILVLIYLLSAALAVCALAAACVVIAMRLVRQRRLARTRRIRARLLPEVFAAVESGRASGDLIAALRGDPAISRDLLAELAELVRGDSRDGLLHLARDCGLDVWLRAQLASRRIEECRSAGELLRLFDDPDSVNALKNALDDPRADVRLTAALSLAELGRTPPLIVLVPRLMTGIAEHSMLLRRLFERIARRDVDDVMGVAAGKIGGARLRPLAIEALGSTGSAQVGEALQAMALDDDPAVRASVLSALADLGYPSARDVIGARLDDEAWQVRVAAVEAVRRMTLFEFVPQLAERLDDEVWWVQFRASEALAALGDAGIGALRRLAESGRNRACRMASLVMAERGLA